MERVAQLIRTAAQIRRMIWASLPLWERFAQVVCRLASSTTDAFGVAMYGLFVENGVEGMPAINGKPASEWVAQHSVNRLPAAYGREFGKKAFLSLMRKYHKPEIVEDILSAFLVKFMGKADQYIKAGTSLRQAEAYVMRSLYNDGINLLRRKRFELGESTLRRDDEDEGPGFLDRSPSQGMEPGDEETVLDSPEMKAKLRRIHPSAEQYVRLLMEGFSDVEILGNPARGKPSMLDHATNASGGPLTATAWVRYKKLIFQAIKGEYPAMVEELEDAAE